MKRGRNRDKKADTNKQADPAQDVDGKATTAGKEAVSDAMDIAEGAMVKAFDNYVISEDILNYLDHQTLKNLSTVNSRMKNLVRNSTSFQNRSKLCVFGESQDRDSPLLPSALNETDFPWKTIAVDLHSCLDKDEFKRLLPFLVDVNSLELYSRAPRICYTDDTLALMLSLVIDVLQATLQLKHLVITVDLLDLKLDYSSMTENIQIQKNLKQLESLCIRGSVIPAGPGAKNFKPTSIANVKSFRTTATFLGLLPKQLATFDFEEISYNRKPRGENECPVKSIIKSILNKHEKTLTTLKLGGFIFTLNGIDSMVFPSLKYVSVRDLESQHALPAANFLSNQSHLKTLEVELRVSEEGRRFIEIPILKHAHTLKKFMLDWTKDWKDKTDYQDKTKWSFELGKLALEHEKNSKLVALPLRHRNSAHNSFDFFSTLEYLKKVKVRHTIPKEDPTPRRRMFWHFQMAHVPPLPLRNSLLEMLPVGVKEITIAGEISETLGVDPSSDVIIDQLGRFHNLSVLNLIGLEYPGIIDDDVLGFICKEMPQLNELGFSNCSKLTDAGLTGQKKNPKTLSPGLKALTDLRKLHMVVGRSHVTAKGILSALSFPSLKELTLQPPAELRSFVQGRGSVAQDRKLLDFFVSLVKQNEHLQLLRIVKCHHHDRIGSWFSQLENEFTAPANHVCTMNVVSLVRLDRAFDLC